MMDRIWDNDDGGDEEIIHERLLCTDHLLLYRFSLDSLRDTEETYKKITNVGWQLSKRWKMARVRERMEPTCIIDRTVKSKCRGKQYRESSNKTQSQNYFLT